METLRGRRRVFTTIPVQVKKTLSPVEMILELLSSGMTAEEILADYEDLEREDILASLSFATRLSQIKRIEPALI